MYLSFKGKLKCVKWSHFDVCISEVIVFSPKTSEDVTPAEFQAT